MKRRKFLVGMGSLAAGSAALMGTGAFSAMTAERAVSINVVNDASGLIALRVGETMESDTIRMTDDGTILIDLSAGDAGGVNVDSRYQYGLPNGHGRWYDDRPEVYLEPRLNEASRVVPAIYIVNQDTVAHEITAEYEVDEPSAIGGSKMVWQWDSTDATQGWMDIESGNPSESVTKTLPSGGRYNATFAIDTREGFVEDSLSGTLTISADDVT